MSTKEENWIEEDFEQIWVKEGAYITEERERKMREEFWQWDESQRKPAKIIVTRSGKLKEKGVKK